MYTLEYIRTATVVCAKLWATAHDIDEYTECNFPPISIANPVVLH